MGNKSPINEEVVCDDIKDFQKTPVVVPSTHHRFYQKRTNEDFFGSGPVSYQKEYVKRILCGANSVIIIDDDGQLIIIGASGEHESLEVAEETIIKYATRTQFKRSFARDIWKVKTFHEVIYVLDRFGRAYHVEQKYTSTYTKYVCIPIIVNSDENVKFVNVGNSSEHGYAVTDKGELYRTSFYGYSSKKKHNFDVVKGKYLKNVKRVKGGYSHVLVFTGDNILLSQGSSLYGQLGRCDGDGKEFLPINYDQEKNGSIRKFYTTYYSCFIINNKGNVYGWGYNRDFSIGIEDGKNIHKPTLMKNLSNVIKMSCGHSHSWFLTAKNEIFCCGKDYGGNLSIINGVRNKAVKVPTKITCLPKGKIIIDMATGFYHNCLLCSDGTILTNGQNTRGQGGDGKKGINRYDFFQIPGIRINLKTSTNILLWKNILARINKEQYVDIIVFTRIE